MSPPIPREPGPQREVDKWGGSLGWPKSSGHSRLGHSLLAIPSSPLMARSRNTMLPASAPGAPPQNFHRGLVQVRSGGVGAEPDCQDPSLNLAQSLGRDRELGDVCACKMDPKQQWGPFSTGAGESLSGGGGQSLAPWAPPYQPLFGYRLSRGTGACPALWLCVSEPVGARGPV